MCVSASLRENIVNIMYIMREKVKNSSLTIAPHIKIDKQSIPSYMCKEFVNRIINTSSYKCIVVTNFRFNSLRLTFIRMQS